MGYIKAKQVFFPFTCDDVVEDVTYLLERYFPEMPLPELRMLNKRTILKQRQRILELFGYRLCTPTDRHDLFLRAQQAARISSKPIYVFRELLHYLTQHRFVKPGEVMEEFTQDIDWLATDSCSLLGTKKQVMAICRRAEAKHRIVGDQRGIIRDAFTRNAELRHDPSGQCVE